MNSGKCPTCGAELSKIKFEEIEKTRKYEEKRRQALAEQAELTMKRQLEIEFKKQIEEASRAAAKRATEESEQELKKAVAEREQLAKKVKELGLREEQIKKQGLVEVEKQKQAAAKKATEEAASRIAKAESDRDLAAKKLKDVRESEANVRKQLQEEAEKTKQKELLQQRNALEQEKKLSLLKQNSEFNRERESYRKNTQLLELKLQRKTANELGDGGEIDVFEALRETFDGSGGKTTRVPKGQQGPDIIHDVFHKGQRCGRIVVDAKNRQTWQNNFVSKLRQDQVEAGAEHAILSTTVFPAGKKQMCIESGVIVISPAQVVYIVQLLRQAIISMHVKGLSMQERASKMTRLYKLITSDTYTGKLSEATKLTKDMLELDVQEATAHSNVWRRRGSLMKRMQNVLREVETEVAAVVEGDGPEGHETTLLLDETVSTSPSSANGRN